MSALPKYDYDKKDFIEELEETSPYTRIFFDSTIGLLGVIRNYDLATSEFNIVKKIEQLFQSTEVVIRSMTNVIIDSIKNPITLINRLRNAYVIKKFTVTFSGPNPFDADEHFHKPMSIYLHDANGNEGKTMIDGDELNSEVLIRMTKSVAATGNEVSARLKDSGKDKVVTVYLHKNPAKVLIGKDIEDTDKIVNKMIDAYMRVRRND